MSIVPAHTKRIMIVGQAGSGKSTLARALGEALRLPVVHIDHIHWKAGWVEHLGDQKDVMCAEVHARDAWIFEGGRSGTWPQRLDRAHVLIWLDFPLPIRVRRAIWRMIRDHGTTPPDLPAGCHSQFSFTFARWMWSSRHSQREMMRELFAGAPADKPKFKLQNKREVDAFVDAIKHENND